MTFCLSLTYLLLTTCKLCEKECAYNASLLMCRCIRVDVALPYEVDWDKQPSGKRRFCDADIARQYPASPLVAAFCQRYVS
ncbi:hypothetical protein V5799_022264 [Amblyomma americanum]|uniref:Secreted protein n=1 Tax=Amblyomma americanum TaxID=6943 RepID=A0AAQ4FMJ8_AMBAM